VKRALVARTGPPALLLALLALAAPAGTEAFFSAPLNLSDAGQNTGSFQSSAQVAVDEDGDAVFVWAGRDGTTGCGGSGCFRIQARARSAAGVLSVVQTLSVGGENAFSPQVAVDQDGEALFVWSRPDATTDCGGSGCERIEARRRTAAGGLSGIVTLSDPNRDAFFPKVAVDEDGDAVFAWERVDETTDCEEAGCQRVQARARSAAGVLSAVQTLSPAGQSAGGAELAIDQDGDAVFTWESRELTTDCGGFGCLRVQARARSAAGVLSTTQNVSVPGRDASGGQVAIDQDGDAVFTWQRVDATTGCGGSGCRRAQVRTRSAAGALGTVQNLSAAGQNAELPEVAVDEDGDAAFTWGRRDGTTDCGGLGCRRIEARARSAAGVLSATAILSNAGQDAFNPEVAIDREGDATFLWRRFDGAGSCGASGCARIQARARSAAGVLGATETLSAAGQNAFNPQIAVDQVGHAVAVWGRPDGTTDCAGLACFRVQAAVAIWSAPLTLSAAGGEARLADVGIDQTGDSVFVWPARNGASACGALNCGQVQARALSAGGVLSAIEPLSGTGQDALLPRLAVEQDGDTVFVWTRLDATNQCSDGSGNPMGCFRIEARTLSAAGALSPVQTLSAAGQNAIEQQVAVDQDGDVVFVWRRLDGTTACGGSSCARIQARTLSAAGVLSATQTLSAAGQHAFHPRVAVDQGGDAVFVWERRDGTTDCGGFACSRIQARVLSAAGVLGTTATISDSGQDASSPAVAADQDGDAVFAWEREDGTTDCSGPSGCTRIQVRARSAAGVLGPVQTLSSAGENTRDPQVAIDADGDTLTVWWRFGAPEFRVQSRARSAAGVLGPLENLSAAGQHAERPQVAMDPAGNAVAVWGRYDGTAQCAGGNGCSRIQARTRSAAGVLGAVQTLSAPGQHATVPDVAVNADGDAVAVWERLDGTTDCGGSGCFRIQAATSPP
jgi:hypothetical protein